MATTSNNRASLQRSLAGNMQQITRLSLNAFKPVMEGMINNMSAMSNSILNTGIPQFKIPFLNPDNCECCPPKETCPPHCIASITKYAMEGERIITAFTVTNDCSQTKSYRIGVRELKDENGNASPSQPTLNKNIVTIDPGRSEQVLMTLDLANFKTGSTYTTEIVLREKEINQNVCFTVIVENNSDTIVIPQDEKKYKLRWQSWKDHYYCERPSARIIEKRNEGNVLSIVDK